LRLVSYDACNAQLLSWFPNDAAEQVLLEVGIEGGSLRLSKTYTAEGLSFSVRNSSQGLNEPGLEEGVHAKTSYRTFASAWESFISALPNWYEGHLLICSQQLAFREWIKAHYRGTYSLSEWIQTANN
jgi:hypothetical protein